MLVRKLVLVVCALVVAVVACGDGGPVLLTQGKSWLVTFKRVTLAADAPDRAEIEIEVRTGPHLSEPAPDGTAVAVETSLGRFAGNGQHIETATVGGRLLVILEISGPGTITINARVHETEAGLVIVVRADGSLSVRAP